MLNMPPLGAFLHPTTVLRLRTKGDQLHKHTRTSICCSAQGAEERNDAAPLDVSSVSSPTPIIDTLNQEKNRVRANFFYPGHKQGSIVHPKLEELTGKQVFAADLPELPELDNLFAPEGILKDAQSLFADTFTEAGSESWGSYFLVNGSTSGVEAAFLSVLRPGSKIILPRNVHQSAVHALVLSGAVPVWVDPVYDSANDLLHGVTPSAVEDAFKSSDSKIDAVLIISPTYHGVVSDISTIAKVCEGHGAKLIVDEAHGAHLKFHDRLPQSATSCGADIVVQSIHKTLMAFSQAAAIHVRKASVDERRVQAALQLVQSSSPNYLLLASLDSTRALMQDKGHDLMESTLNLAESCASRIASLEGFSVLRIGKHSTSGGTEQGLYALDVTKVTVLLPPGLSGYDLDVHLIDRFGVYAELPLFRHVTFVITPGTTQMDIDNLVTSLSLYTATTPPDVPSPVTSDMLPKWNMINGNSNLTPRDAYFADSEVVSVNDAIGRICAETLCPYPPGIPMIIPGERISKESIDLLRLVLEGGGSVSGAADETLSSIRVVVQ